VLQSRRLNVVIYEQDYADAMSVVYREYSVESLEEEDGGDGGVDRGVVGVDSRRIGPGVHVTRTVNLQLPLSKISDAIPAGVVLCVLRRNAAMPVNMACGYWRRPRIQRCTGRERIERRTRAPSCGRCCRTRLKRFG